MKIRTDFVTNSSSSSYIICFARIEDEDKAKAIIEKHNLTVYDREGVNNEKWCGTLGADWCGAEIYGVDAILDSHPDSKYIIIEDWLEADWDEETEEDIFYYDFEMNDAISEITEENGFTDIDVAEGEGRNG